MALLNPRLDKSLLVAILIFVAAFYTKNAEAAESTPGCGKLDKALVGRDARASSPWTATLLYQSNFKCGEFRQGAFGQGVIIGPTTILFSSAFLWADKKQEENAMLLQFNASNFMAVVGLKSRQPFTADQYTQFLKVSYIRVHQRSFARYSDHDMILIHLENPMRYSSYVRPICLDNSPDARITNVASTQKLGDLSLSGFNRGLPDTEPFAFLDHTICSKKLTTEYKESLIPVGNLSHVVKNCGFSSKSREDVQSWAGYGRPDHFGGETHDGLIESRILVEPKNQSQQTATGKAAKPEPVLSNLCYQKGSSIVSYYNDRWYLVGIVGESLGRKCRTNNLYFIQFVTSGGNMDWILQNIWFSTSAFVCDNGQTIELSNKCNDFKDCEDDSDEDSKYCTAVKCGTIFSSYCVDCKKTRHSDTLQILRKTYAISNNTSSEEIKCPPLKRPEGVALHCENPIIKKRITCSYGSDPGTKAVFQCKAGKPSERSSYSVITCKDDGRWTDELKTFVCKTHQNAGKGVGSGAGNDLIITPGVGHNWIDKILLHRIGQFPNSTPDPDTSLENWSPPPVTSGVTSNCPGFRKTPGMKITCRKEGRVTPFPCPDVVGPGTTAEFSCERHYRPIFSAVSIMKTCQPNGRWSFENRAFECRLDCGVPKLNLVGHIVNGQVTQGVKWPWHGIIFRKSKDGQLLYICGATLISKRLLLTAAHCVTDRSGEALPPQKFTIVLGATSNKLEDNHKDPHVHISGLDNVTISPAFNPHSFESDIAIIRLEVGANISEYIRPACFPSTVTQHNELLHLSPSHEGTIIGFGYDESGSPSSKLRQALLPVVSYSECYKVVKVQPSSTMYCAGYTNGTAACNGDSGGGMFFPEDSYPRRMYLQGIVSHGNRDDTTGLCDKNQYSIFTKVASFKNWVNEIGVELDDDF